MDFVDLETFLVLADVLNLTKAAGNLFVSQSTVTHRLKKLESELGYALFFRERGKRSIELTPQGEAFMPIAQRWIILYRETELLKSNDTKTLSIGALDSVVTTILPPVLSELAQDSNIMIRTQHSSEIYDLVKRREVDIGFVTQNNSDPEIISREVFRQRYVVIRPCQNPAGRKKIHPSDLDPNMEIFTSWGRQYLLWHEHWWPVSTSPHITVDSVNAICSFLNDERYWCIVHMSAYQTIQKNYPVQAYDILDSSTPEWNCYKITHKYPHKKSVTVIRSFDIALEKFIRTSNLLEHLP